MEIALGNVRAAPRSTRLHPLGPDPLTEKEAAQMAGNEKSSSRREIRQALVRLQHDLIGKRVKYHNAYQPIHVGTVKSRVSTRECEDRWVIVKDVIEQVEARSLVDFGCAEGFFVRRAGELGLFSLGIDRDYNRLGLIESARMIDRSEKSGFLLSGIDEDLLTKCPKFDVVLCFSVLHHVIRHNNLEYGREILRLMRLVASKAFVFDMGQSTETSTAWAKELPDMGADPAAWVAEFLRSAGFQSVAVAGETDAYKDSVPRYVFKCLV